MFSYFAKVGYVSYIGAREIGAVGGVHSSSSAAEEKYAHARAEAFR